MSQLPKMCARLACAAALLVGTSLASANGLPASINKVIKQYKVPTKALSILVTPVEGGTPLVSHNSKTPRNPASTAKLVTTWAALDLLGPAHKWTTELHAVGDVEAGTLNGDLVIKGGGDPFLVLEEIWKMLGELRRAGIRHITGDLVVDDSRYAMEPQDTGAFDGERHRLYNVIPTALTINFNATRFVFNGSDGRALYTIPTLDNLKLVNNIKRTKGRCKSSALSLRMQVEPDNVVRFSGKLPLKCKDYELSRNVMDSVDYAFGTFKGIWAQWGGTIAGGVRRGSTPEGSKPLVRYKSRPLGELVRPVNKWSNNIMARLLLYAIGATRYAPPVTRKNAAKVLLAHLKKRGINVEQLFIENGSGLSRASRISAQQLVQLLSVAWQRPTMPEFISSLSIVGVDGTTRRRFKRRGEQGRVHVKTGLLRDVVSIAGYVRAKNNRMYTIAMLLNSNRARGGAGRALQDRLIEWVYKR